LQHGAARVIAIDTGYGQLDFRLRQDPRVRLLEKINARYVTGEVIGEKVDLIVIDVAFISATLVIPPVIRAAFPPPGDERSGGTLSSWSNLNSKPEGNSLAREASCATKLLNWQPSKR